MKNSTYILILAAIGVGAQAWRDSFPTEVSAAIVILSGLFFVCRAIEDNKP